MKKILVAYSGGLDTSVILKWLVKEYKCEVVAYCADVGQEEELDGLEEKAIATGASECVIDDLREDFAKNYIFPMLQGQAVYEGQYLLGTSIARPCIANGMFKWAKKLNATHIAHGATGKGNDQVRFELSLAYLDSSLKIIAPWRMENFRAEFPGRAEMIAYAEREKIPVEASASKPYSMDRNLLHISYESGILEDPWFDASSDDCKDMYKLTLAPEDAEDKPEYLQLLYKSGECVGLQFESLDKVLASLGLQKSGMQRENDTDYAILTPFAVLRILNLLGKKHAIGRKDIVENRYVGMKSRGVYETPGGSILLLAHRQIESLTIDREVMHLRDGLIPRYAEMIYNGYWFSPERLALQEFISHTQKNVSGEVRLKLYKGNIICAGRRSQNSLYLPDVATMEGEQSDYNQDDATGFIRINSLRLKT